MMFSARWAVCAIPILVGACSGTYPYRATNDQCECETLTLADEHHGVRYTFSAVYTVDDVVRTRIEVLIENRSNDTLDLSLAYVRVSSKNIPYQYNDLFRSLKIDRVLPGRRETLMLAGEAQSPDGRDPWLRIAGEELVVTLKGIRKGGRELPLQRVTFVPHNPKLRA